MANKFGRIADWFIPGNAYNSTLGRWNPATTKTGIAGLVADQFVPGGSTAVSGLANGGAFGQDFKRDLRREEYTNDITNSFRPFARQLRDGMNPQVEVDDIGGPMGIGNVSPGGYGQAGSLAGMVGNYQPRQPSGGAPPSGPQAEAAPGGFAGGVFNGGQGNFGPTNLPGMQVNTPMSAQERFTDGGKVRPGQGGWGKAPPGQFSIERFMAAKPAMGGGGMSGDELNVMLRAARLTK